MTNYPHIDPAKPLMVVVDTSVLLHQLHQSIPMEHNDPQLESALRANLTWLMSGAWLGSELRPLMRSMVFVKDVKPYWRVEWLADIANTINLPRKTKAKAALAEQVKELLALDTKTEEQLEQLDSGIDKLNVKYKAGRSLPAYKFTKIKKLVYQYLDQLEANQMGSSGYEADDMAAAIVQNNTDRGNPYNILLLTVDTDWLGLVNPSVTWCCMSGFFPTVRDSLEVVNSWTLARLKCTLTTWREIWDVKGDKGDASDNLPASDGQLLPVIDLLNPPIARRFWVSHKNLVSSMFTNGDPRFTLEEAKAAKHHLVMLGLRPVNNLLPGERLEPAMQVDGVNTNLDDMINLLSLMPRIGPSEPTENQKATATPVSPVPTDRADDRIGTPTNQDMTLATTIGSESSSDADVKYCDLPAKAF